MRVAIIGSGQLARMLALAGLQMGLRCSFLAEHDEDVSSVEGLGPVVRRAPGAGPLDLLAALGNPDVVTVERENVDVSLLGALTDHCPVYPRPDTVATLQHRLAEKRFIADLGLDTSPFRGATTVAGVADAVRQLGLPVVVKTCRDGYDGKGQWRLRSARDLQAFCRGQEQGDWLVESLIPFEREISILAVRSVNGEVALYPATENSHSDGILLTSIAPSLGLPAAVERRAREYAHALLQSLDYVGVLAMECFVWGERLLINELAPRVHNSGHWTFRSEATSQFENHLRALLGMPLGNTEVSRCEAMINVLGQYNREYTLRQLPPQAALVDYNKSAAPRRKVAHVHISGRDHGEVMQHLGNVQRVLYPAA